MSSAGYIPRNRLVGLPAELRLAHEYCYFLHDSCARLLVECERIGAHSVTINFRNLKDAAVFEQFKGDPIGALRAAGYERHAKRVILNNISVAMLADSLHHVFEALKCLEKRKPVVSLNLLRKPLTDSLLYFSWMLADEAEFYSAFANGAESISQKTIGNFRRRLFENAISQTLMDGVIDADYLEAGLFDAKNPAGLYGLFQHAVHLVTVQRLEIKTSPENFNFIFKDFDARDVHAIIYGTLPGVLLYFSHVVFALFDRIAKISAAAKEEFLVRSVFALPLIYPSSEIGDIVRALDERTGPVSCGCSARIAVSRHNAARLILTERIRCGTCGRVSPMDLDWTLKGK